MTDSDVVREVHQRYKAKCAEVRRLEAENRQLKKALKQANDMLDKSFEIVETAKDIIRKHDPAQGI